MKGKLYLLVGLLVVALLISACGPTPINGGGSATLNVVNESGREICDLYVSPVTDDTWNADLMSGRIAVGATHVVENINPGDYDLRADFCDGGAPLENYGFTINGGETWRVR
jgi:hypothetical protein